MRVARNKTFRGAEPTGNRRSVVLAEEQDVDQDSGSVEEGDEGGFADEEADGVGAGVEGGAWPCEGCGIGREAGGEGGGRGLIRVRELRGGGRRVLGVRD